MFALKKSTEILVSSEADSYLSYILLLFKQLRVSDKLLLFKVALMKCFSILWQVCDFYYNKGNVSDMLPFIGFSMDDIVFLNLFFWNV